MVDSEPQKGLLSRRLMNVIRLKGCIDLRLANVEIDVKRETRLAESTDRPTGSRGGDTSRRSSQNHRCPADGYAYQR